MPASARWIAASASLTRNLFAKRRTSRDLADNHVKVSKRSRSGYVEYWISRKAPLSDPAGPGAQHCCCCACSPWFWACLAQSIRAEFARNAANREQSAAHAISRCRSGAPRDGDTTACRDVQPPENSPVPQTVPPRKSTAPPSAQAPSPPSSSATAQSTKSCADFTSAAPANVAAAAPRYWVEFGAYEGAFSMPMAEAESADELGIAATVTEARGAHDRKYLRVRSNDQSDRAAALALLSKAHDTLHIAPLLHSVAAVSPGATRAMPPSSSPTSTTHSGSNSAPSACRENANNLVTKLSQEFSSSHCY